MQDSLLWSQWCPYYRGSLCRTAYYGPNGVLIIEVHCTGQLTVSPTVSLLERFHCTGQLTVDPMVYLL